jgi:hypothetical protein
MAMAHLRMAVCSRSLKHLLTTSSSALMTSCRPCGAAHPRHKTWPRPAHPRCPRRALRMRSARSVRR